MNINDKKNGQARFIFAHTSGNLGDIVTAVNQPDCPEWFHIAHYSAPSRFVRAGIIWNQNAPTWVKRMIMSIPQDWYVQAGYKWV